jgi:RND family efflux transporter MFP subunit
MKRIWILSGAALLAACGGGEPQPARPAAEPVAVTVSDVWSAPAAVAHVARVEAAREADVATRASGQLVRLPVDVGDPVRAGQMLAELDGADIEARIAAASAQAELAERTHGRIERLAADGAASQQEMEEAAARLEAARAQLADARAQATYVQVRAPFDGVVVARYADPGDLAVPGRPVLRIAGSGALKIVADLPSELAGTVRAGAVVRLVDGRGASSEATVVRVVPNLDPATRRFRVELRPDPTAALTAGEVVRLEFATDGVGTRWIPADALVRRGQLTGVFVLEGDTLRLRWLRTGRDEGERVELLAGPAGVLTVVRRPASTLRDGQPVASVTRETAGEAAGEVR